MPLLDDLIPAEHLREIIAALLADDARIATIVERKHIRYEAVRAHLRASGICPTEIKALIAELKARVDTGRKQPRHIQAGKFPAHIRTRAIEFRVPRTCVARGAGVAMAEAA